MKSLQERLEELQPDRSARAEWLQALETYGLELVGDILRTQTGTSVLVGRVSLFREFAQVWRGKTLADQKAAQDRQQADMVKAAKWSAGAAIAAAIAAFLSLVATIREAFFG